MIQYGNQNNMRKYLVEMFTWSILKLQILKRFSSLLGLWKRDQFIPILFGTHEGQFILEFLVSVDMAKVQ